MISQGSSIAIQLASTVILSRLLSPNDYGVMTMVMALVSFAGLFRDLGLSSAAIQKKDLTRAQQSNLFWLNTAMGALMTILVAVSSPLVVWFYGKPELLWVTVALSATFLIGSLGTQHGAMLVRNMQFGRKAVAGIAGSVITLATAVGFAMNGYAYWSLVCGNIVGGLTTTTLLFILSPFQPRWITRGTGIRNMLKFGANITAFDVVNYFARNLDNFLIGKFIGTAALGIYGRAYSLLMLPISSLRGPITSVTYPALCRLRDQPEAWRDYYLKTVLLLAFLSMPLACWLYLVASPLVLLLLGESWEGVAPLFSILAIVCFIQPSSSMGGSVMLSLGRSRNYFLVGTFNAIVVSLGFLVGVQWGAQGVAWSYVCTSYLLLLPTLIMNYRGSCLKVRDFFQVIAFPAVLNISCLLFVTGLERMVPQALPSATPWLEITVKSAWFFSLWAAVLFFSKPGMRLLVQAKGMVSLLFKAKTT